MRLTLLLLFVLTFILATPTYATPQSHSDAIIVATGLGTHDYTLHGERWVYRDNGLVVSYTATSGVNPDSVTKTVIVRWNGFIVGKWVNVVEVYYAADWGGWGDLHTLASGLGSK